MNWRRGLLRLWLVGAGFLWGKDAAWANWKVPGGPIEADVRVFRCTYSVFPGRPQHLAQNLSSKDDGVSG
jgi:hypothetical protein